MSENNGKHEDIYTHIQYMRNEMKELRNDVKQLSNHYVRKEEHQNTKKNVESLNENQKTLLNWKNKLIGSIAILYIILVFVVAPILVRQIT